LDNKKYVLKLLEDGSFIQNATTIGYWTGKKYYAEDVCFPGVVNNKDDTRVKVYTSKKTS
jgi:hypothetical protein